MIDEIAKKLGKAQNKKPWLFIISFILVILLTIPGIFLLVGNVEASLENVLPPSIDEIAAMNDARTQYSADMNHIVAQIRPPLTNINQADEYLEELQQRIELIPLVKNVEQGENNLDETITVIDIQTDTGANSERIRTTIQEIEEALNQEGNPGVELSITGFAAIDKATFTTIMSDFLLITGVAMSLVLLIVYSQFKTLRLTLIPMAAVMVALIVTMGITGYLGITITVVTMVAAAMILGLGIDFGIHTIHSYGNYRKKMKPKKALEKTVNELFRAQLGASLTTSAGFLALSLGVLPAMANLGLVLAIGILTTFVASTMLLPPLLLLTEGTK